MGTGPQRKRRRRRKNPNQMEFAFESVGRPFRTTVLDIINESTVWRTAHHIAAAAGLTYPQTIFALLALHNAGKIARTGRKFTAKWGPLAIDKPADTGYDVLQSLFNSSVKRG